MATQPQVRAGSPRQLALVAALFAVLLLAVGLLVVRPMLSGDSQPAAAPPPATAGAAATTPRLIGPSTSVGAGAPGAAAAGSVKDPFQPVVDTGAASATTVSGVSPGASTPGATTPGASTPGATTPEASTPGGGATAERKVALLGIAGGKAKVSVDGTTYTVEEGESFASDYRATDIGTECATFESGTTPFTLCEGEAVLK
jgi:hypothetical protein